MERLIAKKCRIQDLHGDFVEKSGTTPSYIDTPYGQISRVNLIAAVIEKAGPNALLLDDGSAKISTRAFDDAKLFDNIMVGDIILLIGRPRTYKEENYVVAEIAKRLGSPKWLELRKAELGKVVPAKKKSAPKEKIVIEESEELLVSTTDQIIECIRSLDSGDGAPIENIVKKFKNADNILSSLMAEGEIFEIKPGRVKVLD